MQRNLDYRRYGRQIALPELGADGQRTLERTTVAFEGDARVAGLAAILHERAGGAVGSEASVTVVLPAVDDNPRVHLGVAAWGAVEAARRALGRPAAVMPQALLERLGA